MQEAKLGAAGLWTRPNKFLGAPPGAMKTATNVIVPAEGVIANRPGSKWRLTDTTAGYNAVFGATFGAAQSMFFAKRPNAATGGGDVFLLFQYQPDYTDATVRRLMLYTPNASATNKYQRINTTLGFSLADIAFGPRVSLTQNISPLLSYSPPMRWAESGGNIYATSKSGMLRINNLSAISGNDHYDSATYYANWPIWAGVPRAGTCIPTLYNAVAGFLPPDSACAYSAVWCIKDSFGKIIKGYPGGREVVRHVPVDIQTGSPTTGYSGGASRAAAGTLTTVTVTANGGWPTFPYKNGDTLTITYKNNEDTHFHTGSYVIGAVATVGATTTFTYTETGANPAGVTPSTLAISLRGPSLAVSLEVAIPQGVVALAATAPIHFFQIYRSELTVSATTEPTEDKRLVYESPLVAGDMAAPWTKTVIDIASPAFAGEYIYTAPALGGTDSGNVPVPSGADICEYAGSLFVANTTLNHSVKLNLLTASATTITVGAVPFTSAGYTGISIGDSIAKNAKDLVKQINQARGAWTAWYEGQPDDPSTIGLFRIETTYRWTNNFSVTLGTPSHWQQTTPVISDCDFRGNRLYYSKPQQPEAFAAGNYLDVGNASSPIVRIEACQNSLFVFKYEGVFRVTGFGGQFSVEPFDMTKHILAGETVKKTGNAIYGLFTAGIVVTSEAGCKLISQPIQGELDTLLANNSSSNGVDWNAQFFGVASDLHQLYLMFPGPFAYTGGYTTKAYAYNIKTNTWTLFDWGAGVISPVTGDVVNLLDFTCASSDPNGDIVVCQTSDDRRMRMLTLDRPGSAFSGDYYFYRIAAVAEQIPALMSMSWLPFLSDNGRQRHFRHAHLVFSGTANGSIPDGAWLGAFGTSAFRGAAETAGVLRSMPIGGTLTLGVPRTRARGQELAMDLSVYLPAAVPEVQLLAGSILFNEAGEDTGDRNL